MLRFINQLLFSSAYEINKKTKGNHLVFLTLEDKILNTEKL